MGLQETRVQQDAIKSIDGFWVLSSNCTAEGTGGCQLWFSQDSQGGSGAEVKWNRQAFSVVHAQPQILVALAEIAGIRFACVSAHAPPSGTDSTELQQWWQDLQTAFAKIPRGHSPVMCIDANARFQKHPAGRTSEALPICPNGEHLSTFTQAQGMVLSAQQDARGHPIVSWISPKGKGSLIDYIAVPQEWSACFRTGSNVALGDLHQDIDHQAIFGELTWKASVPPATSRRVSSEQLASTEGQEAIRHAFNTLPIVPWEVDATTHVTCIHEHIERTLQQALPAPELRPRHPALTADTLELIGEKGHQESHPHAPA